MAHPRLTLAVAIALTAALPAYGAVVKPVHRFANTGNSVPSQFALGAAPVAELLQASDGNFYGTTYYGGSGVCQNSGGTVVGCGTIFRMTPKGAVKVLYSFVYDTNTQTAPAGVYPTAGLIQGKDGFLYGVASDGGIDGCNGALGCGTLFRVSTSGSFKLLHQFCDRESCPGSVEGGKPMAHLVQLSNGSLCGTAAQGGEQNQGTLFCASTDGTVNTLYDFNRANGTDGVFPEGALLVGADGTFYGTTVAGGANSGGTAFAFKASTLTTLHAFDSSESSTPGTYFEPMGALIFGADGRLYGTTYSGGTAGCIYALNTDGTGFSPKPVFDGVAEANATANSPVVGMVLARDGLMYGTTEFGSSKQDGNNGGAIYRYNPVTGAYKGVASFISTTGYAPRAALIEGTDNVLYGTTSLHGEKDGDPGTDTGTVYRLMPALTE